MKVALRFSCVSLLVFGFAHSTVLPVEKCTLTDKACMVSAAQKMVPIFTAGMPEHGIEVLDPMAMDDINIDLSGLQFSMSGGTWKGLNGAVIDDIDFDTNKKILTIDFHSDAVVEGKYTAAGAVLDRPISGDGKIKMEYKNLQIKFFIHFDMDKDHVTPTKYNFEFDVKDNLHYELSNLFGGDKEKSDSMLTFLNENWKPISIGFGHPLVDTAAKKWFKNIAVLFKKLPIAEIANV